MKRDYLNGTPYEIEQPKEMYHFNSDTELLGRFMRLKKTDSVLDVGCATGALLCYAAVQEPAELYGIDLFDEVIAQADQNLKENHISAVLNVCRLQDYRPGRTFSVIVCNPPYFDTKNDELKNLNPYLAAARHESNLSMYDLFQSAASLMSEDGVFYLVHRADRINELFYTAEKFGLMPVRMQLTYKNIKGLAAGVLLCFSKRMQAKLKCDAPVFLDDRSTFEDEKGEGR